MTDDDVTLGEVYRSVKRLEISIDGMSSKLENLPADRQRLAELERRLNSLVSRNWVVFLALLTLAASVAGLFLRK